MSMTWTKVKVVGSTLTIVDGPKAGYVLSFGPAGWEPPTPPGTSGPYEVCDMDGGFATYTPPGGPPGVFPFRPRTTEGVSLIAQDNPQ